MQAPYCIVRPKNLIAHCNRRSIGQAILLFRSSSPSQCHGGEEHHREQDVFDTADGLQNDPYRAEQKQRNRKPYKDLPDDFRFAVTVCMYIVFMHFQISLIRMPCTHSISFRFRI